MNEMKTKIQFRVTKEEKKELMEMARVRGLTVSELIRQTFFGRKITIRWQDQGKGSREK